MDIKRAPNQQFDFDDDEMDDVGDDMVDNNRMAYNNRNQ